MSIEDRLGGLEEPGFELDTEAQCFKNLWYCKICDDDKYMEFIGNQMIDGQKLFELYNCPSCGTTKTENYTQYYYDNYEV